MIARKMIAAFWPMTEPERKAHIRALTEVLNEHDDKDYSRLFSHLYQALNILDSKTSNLAGFNSLLFTVCSLIISISSRFHVGAFNGSIGDPAFIAIAASAILAFLSAVILMFVIWLHWSSTQDLGNPDDHIDTLLRVRNARTIRYRISWLMSLVSLVLLAVYLSLASFRLVENINQPAVVQSSQGTRSLSPSDARVP